MEREKQVKEFLRESREALDSMQEAEALAHIIEAFDFAVTVECGGVTRGGESWLVCR